MYDKRSAKLNVIDRYKLWSCQWNCERWVCTQRACKTYMKMRNGHILEPDLHHNHPRDSENRLMRQMVAKRKRKAADDMFERPSKVMCREMSATALEVLTEDDRVQIRKSIHRAREKHSTTVGERFTQTVNRLGDLHNTNKARWKFYVNVWRRK